MQSTAGKIVLITGAAMGMGRLYALRAVGEGAASVILWDVDATSLATTTQELRALGGTVAPFFVDISSLDAIVEAADRVRAEVGDPQVLINNAGARRASGCTTPSPTPRRQCGSTRSHPCTSPASSFRR